MELVLRYFIFFMLLLLADIFSKADYKSKKICYFFIFLLFALSPFFFRGPDYENYSAIFNRLKPINQFSFNNRPHGEIGFHIIIALFKVFSDSFELFIFGYNAAIVAIFMRLNILYQTQSLTIYSLYAPKTFINANLNQIRVAGLFSFFPLLLNLLSTEKTKKYVITVLCLMLLHFSSVFLLIPLALLQILSSRKKIIIFFLLFLPIGLVTEPVIRHLYSLFNQLPGRYYFYNFSGVNILSIQTAIRVTIFGFTIWITNSSRRDNILLTFAGLSLLSYVFFSFNRIFAERISAIFGIIEPYIFMTFLDRKFRDLNKNYRYVLVIFWVILNVLLRSKSFAQGFS